MKFQDALRTFFKFRNDQWRDNLPIRAIHRRAWGTRGDRGRAALARMMAALEFRTGVEIGTKHGTSAEMWCKRNPLLHLTCIDPYTAYYMVKDQERQEVIYAQAMERLKPYNATIMREFSMDVLDEFEDGSLDFIFIDGNHNFDYVVMDLVCWAKKVRDGGLIALHDYYNFEKAGIIKAVDAYTHCHRIDPWYVTFDDTPSAFWEKGVERSH
jgi:predicted O-methyltransferase YrrM